MLIAMYAMIASFNDFVVNLKAVYMALLTAAPMAVIMLLMMRDMYQGDRAGALILAVSIAVFVGALFRIRTQTPIGEDDS